MGTTESCCPLSTKPDVCREGCACCPDGSWTTSIGDGKTFTCGDDELVVGVDDDLFGEECEKTTTTSSSPTATYECPCVIDLYDPFCCGGETYANGCEARCAGFDVDNDCKAFACESTTTTDPTRTTDKDCCSLDDKDLDLCRDETTTGAPGCICCPDGSWALATSQSNSDSVYYYCENEKLEYGVDDDAFGRECPTESTTTTEPPCGCDKSLMPYCCRDETYDNACLAECAGFNVDADCEQTVCDTTTTTSTVLVTDNGCSDDYVCTLEYNPYCCRGEDFGNACQATCDGGFNVDEECSNNECDECACTREYDPYCCNDKTYSNGCLARCGGFPDFEDVCENIECVPTGVSGAAGAKVWAVVMMGFAAY